jgi:hypothetical protein
LDDIDIRPVMVDQLTQFASQDLAARLTRIETLLQTYLLRRADADENLRRLNELCSFLEAEKAKVELAQRLQTGDVVRVVCPDCRGSGLKPTDVTSGRIQTGSAFESVRAPVQPENDPRLQCGKCEGKKWIIMERYRG